MDLENTDLNKLTTEQREVFFAVRERFLQNKQTRFEQSSRILTGKHTIRVEVIHKADAPPAWFDMGKRLLVLNQTTPKAQDDAERLIYDRALIYHECGHIQWTRDPKKLRETLTKASPNPQLFLDVSNILEDGRIEWIMSKAWAGSKAYLNSLIQSCFEQNKEKNSPMSGLIFYVRYHRFICQAQADYWKPFIGLIDKAIRALNSKAVFEIADEIVRKLAQSGQANPNDQLPNDDKEESEGKGEGNAQSGEQSESESGEQSKSEESESDEQGEGEGEESESSEGESEGDSSAKGAGKTNESDDEQSEEQSEIESFVKQIAEQAISELMEKAQQEVADLKAPAEILSIQPENQLFADEQEVRQSEQCAVVLQSIKVDRTRRNWQPAQKSGRIDSRRIVGVRSGDSFLVRREEAKGEINAALLIDCSGSMRTASYAAFSCARIINGALQMTGIKSVAVYFGTTHGGGINTVPNVGLQHKAQGGTPTGEAMEAALKWLNDERKAKGKSLMLIITDGMPNDVVHAQRIYADCKNDECLVIVIGIGNVGSQTNTWCDRIINVYDTNKLSDQLEEVVIDSVGQLFS